MQLRTVLVILPVVWVGTVASAQIASNKNPLGHGADVVAAGHTLFNRTCTACHGNDGTEGERGPALVGDRRFFRLSEVSLHETMKNGISGTAMPAIGLPDDDLWRIATWIRAMRGSASETDVSGDPAHGAIIFAGKGGCEQCHMINGKGGTIGPDLSNIGAQITLSRLRESLTQSGAIQDDYRPIKVVTRRGQTIEGIAKNEDTFSVQILDLQNQLHSYKTDELKQIIPGTVSLMPHNYDKVLTAPEYQDLVAMLAHQVQTNSNLDLKRDGEGEAGR